MTNQETATIDANARCVTLVNVYEVDPERQGELVSLLARATNEVIRHQPGFLSVSLHSSLDGKRVVNYAQWASKEHFEGFMKRPETQAQLKQFAALANAVSPGLYKVDAVHGSA